jgi:hypothetical protein
MDNKEKLSGSQNNGGTVVKPEDKPLSPASNGGKPSKNEVKTKKSKPKSNKGTKPKEKPSNGEAQSKKEMEPQVLITLIGAIVTIVVAIINSQAIIGWLFKPDPTPTIIPTAISSPTLFISDTPTLSITDTLIPVITPSITYTPTISITSTDIPVTVTPGAKMEVYLYADKTSGKKPLRIRFDARDSYLREPNGTKFPCRGGPCHYTWKVYSNGTQLGKSVTDAGGTFEYSFGERGVYLVTVDICRGRDKLDCGGAGIQIEVTR